MDLVVALEAMLRWLREREQEGAGEGPAATPVDGDVATPPVADAATLPPPREAG